jgi:hypothetical protein
MAATSGVNRNHNSRGPGAPAIPHSRDDRRIEDRMIGRHKQPCIPVRRCEPVADLTERMLDALTHLGRRRIGPHNQGTRRGRGYRQVLIIGTAHDHRRVHKRTKCIEDARKHGATAEREQQLWTPHPHAAPGSGKDGKQTG